MKNLIYTYGDGLYLNITNKCCNQCKFCVRQCVDGLGDTESLWLEDEPTVDEVMEGLKDYCLEEYEEIIFCGYGEPLMELDKVLEVSKRIKEGHSIRIRINTNGLSDLINCKETAPLLSNYIDALSISLNEADEEKYLELCKPDFGEGSYKAVIDFIKSAKKHIPYVAVSVVGCISNESMEKCREISKDLGVPLKIR